MMMYAKKQVYNFSIFEIEIHYFNVAQLRTISSISCIASTVEGIKLCHNKAILASNAKKGIGF